MMKEREEASRTADSQKKKGHGAGRVPPKFKFSSLWI
jgi:hypothetical protein